MKKIMAILLVVVLGGCATIGKGSENYLEKGMIRKDLAGHSYYMAHGIVNVYILFGLAPVRKADTAVGILVNNETGEIRRIVTVQPAGKDVIARSDSGNTIYGQQKYGINDLIGGISVIELYKMGSWDETLSAVNKRATRL